MSVQLIESYGCYQARVYPRGPGQTRCFSIAQYGDAGARARAEKWAAQRKRPPQPKPATSTRSSSGLRGIGFKWAGGVLQVVVNLAALKTTRSVREHGAPGALRLVVEVCGRVGVPQPAAHQFAAALRKLRQARLAGPPRRVKKKGRKRG